MLSLYKFIIMRKVKRAKRMAQLALDKPLPIIRFDISEYSQNLLRAPSNRAVDFCKKTIGIHTHLLKLSAAEANTVCLASNQVMLDSSLIAINKNIKSNQSKERGMNWIDFSYNKANDFRVYHFPKVLKGKQLVQHIEESISYPFILFRVKRYNNIVIEYKDENYNKLQAQLTNFQALAFQQAQQQIKGETLLDWRINSGKIQFSSQVVEYFPKSASVIEQYVQDLAKTFKQYPQLLHKPQKFEHPEERRNQLQNQILPYETDFYKRLTKHYQRQMGYLEERIQEGLNLSGQKQKWKEPKQINVKVIDK